MGERARSRDHQHEGHIAPRAEAARQRGAERQQPSHIEADMEEVGVEERVGEERPQIGAEAAGKRTAGNEIDVVARRNEGEGQQKAHIFGVGQNQHAQRMHEHQHGHRRDNDRRHIEHRL